MPDSWADIITNTWSVRTKTVGINMMMVGEDQRDH